jgi:hypothetical protein
MRNIFLLAIILFGCSKQQEWDQIEMTLYDVMGRKTAEQAKKIFLIPKVGCGGCIDNAVLFVKENIKVLGDVHIIFTGIEDLKLLKLSLGSEIYTLNNIYIDKNRAFENFKEVSIYPKIIIMDEGRIKDIKTFDINNSEIVESIMTK